MRCAEVGEYTCAVEAQRTSRIYTESRTSQRCSIVSEADETLVKGCIPERGQQETVMHVEALLVGALGPRLYVRSA
jgi:hypothetical protein